MRIAVIGSGIAGLGAAWLLSRRHQLTIYEADARLGGHSNTVDVVDDDRRVPVDAGFIVFNEDTYPNLIALFGTLGVATKPSDMSFSVSIGNGAMEYKGSPGGLLAQPSNLLKPAYYAMVADITRFFATAPRLLDDRNDPELTLGDYLRREGYGERFLYDHLLPMAAAIWSCPAETMLGFPARSFIRFFVNHGLLKRTGRPQWFTVEGGSRSYVRRLAQDIEGNGGKIRTHCPSRGIRRLQSGVMVKEPDGSETFYDQVVLATHGDQALSLLSDADTVEREVLGSFSYQDNLAILHRDPSLMPRRKRVWSSWNYLADGARDPKGAVSVTYWMNRLQGIDERLPLFVSLNPLREPSADTEIARFSYAHPVFDSTAMRAQGHLATIQGLRDTWFCGSYCGYGFHEDGLRAAIAVARGLGVEPPWQSDVAPAGTHWIARQSGPHPIEASGDD